MSVSATAPRSESTAREFKAANACLGIRNPTLLGYETGELNSLEAGQLEEVLLDVLKSFKPQVVITVTTDGANPDPDRAEVHAAAAAAFFRARQLNYRTAAVPARLYYGSWPRQHVRRALGVLKAAGNPTDFIRDPERYASPDSSVTTIIDVRSSLDRKVEALRAYSVIPAGVDTGMVQDLWGLEYYTRAHPNPWVTGVIERELFRGLTAPEERPGQAGRLAS
jgi:LmbE family N-acetylglucosaminyl deacetylase